jgi:hypothetical protein
MLRVAQIAANQLVEAARNSTMAYNPAWIGWVFQLQFFGHLYFAIEHKLGLTLTTRESTNTQWPTKSGAKRYLDPTELCGERMMVPGPERFANKLNLRAGDWLIPTRWNQGCFDVLQVCENTLRVVQVTVAKTHSLKLRFVRQVLEKLTGMMAGGLHTKSDFMFSHRVRNFKS